MPSSYSLSIITDPSRPGAEGLATGDDDAFDADVKWLFNTIFSDAKQVAATLEGSRMGTDFDGIRLEFDFDAWRLE